MNAHLYIFVMATQMGHLADMLSISKQLHPPKHDIGDEDGKKRSDKAWNRITAMNDINDQGGKKCHDKQLARVERIPHERVKSVAVLIRDFYAPRIVKFGKAFRQ